MNPKDPSKTLCSAFWHHTNIRPGDEIFPCCRFKEPIQTFDGDLSTILHSSTYTKLRKQSLAGDKLAGCEKCYYEEENGRKSLRQHFNDEYDCSDISLNFLEIGFDNICNLTCDGCNEEFSSSWAKKLNSAAPHIKTTSAISELPDTVDKILFLGGEPLMSKRHLKFMDLIKNKNTTRIIYNTNGTFILNEPTISALKLFKSVTFILSIDGYGKLNDTVRSGSNWNDILKFIEQIKGLNFGLEINAVLHLNNWFGLTELAKFINELGVRWNCRTATYPAHLDIKNLNESNKKILTGMIHTSNIPNKEYILKHIA